MAVHYELKEQLDAARMAMFHHWAISPEAVKLRASVFALAPKVVEEGARTRAAQAKEITSANDSLDAWLADLLKASLHVEAGGYFYRSTDRQAFSDDPDCKVSARNFEGLTERLLAVVLIDHQPGFQVHGDMDGPYIERRRAGRYRATQRLLEVAESHGVTPETLQSHYAKPKRPAIVRNDTVIVKTAEIKKRMKPLPPSAKLSEIEEQVRRINQALSQHEFSLDSHPVIRRGFSRGDIAGFNYSHEGRLYAAVSTAYR